MAKPIAIAIVGVGAIFAGARNSSEFWREIIEGKDLITEVPLNHWEINDYYDKNAKVQDKTYCRRGSFLPNIEFDPVEWGVPPQIIKNTDTSQLLALIAAKAVLKDAYQGNFFGVDLSHASIILGTTQYLSLISPLTARLYRPVWAKAMKEHGFADDLIKEVCDRIDAYFPVWDENSFPGTLMNVVAGRIANRFNFGGTNCVTDAACASSFAALSMAVNELLLHQAELVVTGGVDTLNDIFSFECFSKTPALSPSEDCRPFSSKADGTLLAEGVGLFALKRLEDAEKDGNRIYAVIRGIGSSSDGRYKSIYAPVAKGQSVAAQRAYDMAGYSPSTVELVEAHGTGTKAGDVEEFKGLKETFEKADNKHTQWCALGSIKSQIGHAKGAAGAAGLFKIVMGLHHKVLPPTIKVEKPDPRLKIQSSPFYLNTKARPWIKHTNEIRRAAVSAFGFGGTNFHITVEEYKGPGKCAFRIAPCDQHLLLLSEKSVEELIKRCEAIQHEASEFSESFIPFYARKSYESFQAEYPYRLALIVKDEKDLNEKLFKVIAYLKKNSQEKLVDKNIYINTNQNNLGKTAFLFSGQGSQYLNMGSDLAMAFNVSRQVWDLTSEVPFDIFQSLHDVVFPKSVFSEEEGEKQQNLLNNTIWTQPALATVAFSQLAILNELNVKADCVAGHSIGELIALAYAGAFDFTTLLKIARKRGELMEDSSSAEKGGMLAVLQPITKTLDFLKASGLSLVPANFNSPQELILSGSKDEIEKAKRLLHGNHINFKEFPVSNAFHSPVMKNAAVKFSSFLEDLHFEKLNCPVYSNVSAQTYTQEESQIKSQISDALEKPVRFVEMIEAMYASGVRTFIEIGPHRILNDLVKSVLNDKDFQIISIDNKNENGVISLWQAIGQLAVRGFKLNFNQLLYEYDVPAVPETKKSKKHMILINGAVFKPTVLPLQKKVINQKEQEPVPEIKTTVTQAISTSNEVTPPVTTPTSSAKEPTVKASYSERKDSSLIDLYKQIERSVANAHEMYQKSVADAHHEFLHIVGKTLDQLQKISSSYSSEIELDLWKKDISATQPPPKTETLPKEQPETKLEAKISDMTSAILAIIAAETGYPVETLSMQMEMEADLGIDSIKRVEILSEIQEKFPDLSEIDLTQLASLKTLQQLNDFVGAAISAKKQTVCSDVTSGKIPEQPSAPVKSPTASDLTPAILAIIAAETGYPIETLSMQMEMEADLGIDSIKRVEILSEIQEQFPDLPEIDPTQLASLKTLQQLNDYIDAAITGKKQTSINVETRPSQPINPIQDNSSYRQADSLQTKPLTGRVFPGLKERQIFIIKDKKGIAAFLAQQLKNKGINAQTINNTTDLPDKNYGIIYLNGLQDFTSAEEAVNTNNEAFEIAKTIAKTFTTHGGTLVLTQNTGGDFGLSGDHPLQAWSSGLVALARTARLEWPKANIKAIDLDCTNQNADMVANRLTEELLMGGEEQEVGIKHDGSRVILESGPIDYDIEHPLKLSEGSVVLVSGGGRGVTSWCVEALSAHYRLHFILLGRTVLDKEPEYCKEAQTAADLKKKLYEHTKEQNKEVSFKTLDQQAALILANREIQQTMASLKAKGSDATYYSGDIQDPKRLKEIIAEVEKKYGQIKGLIHGAGIIQDRMIEQKTKEQFEQVFNPKVKGLSILLETLAFAPLQFICLFSSVVARFGNKGQSDYAMANQILNTVAAVEQKRRGNQCLVKSINWGAWEGGMVTPLLQKQFHERGIELLSQQLGTELFLKELSQTKPISILLSCGWEVVSSTTSKDLINEDTAVFTITPTTHSFLMSHCINKNPVIPVCLALEWFMRSVKKHFLNINEITFNKLKVLHGIRLNDLSEQDFTVLMKPKTIDTQYEIIMELRTNKAVPAYMTTATINSNSHKLNVSSIEENEISWPFKIENCYGDLTKSFHGPDFHCIQSLDTYGEKTASATLLGIHFLKWPKQNWVTDPGIVDGAFQVASLFSQRFFNRLSLPMRVDKIRLYQQGIIKEPVICSLQLISHSKYYAKFDLVLMRKDGGYIMEFNGLEMVAIPSVEKEQEWQKGKLIKKKKVNNSIGIAMKRNITS